MAWVIVGALAIVAAALAAGPFLWPGAGVPRDDRPSGSPLRPDLRQDIEEDYLMGKLDAASRREALEDEEQGL